MNPVLVDTYKKLSETQKTELHQKHKDSLVMLRLHDYLGQLTTADFKTSDAVTYVYKGSHEDYRVLENRYFKLRKKLIDDMQSLSGSAAPQQLPEEEAILNQCKYLLTSGDKKEAYKKLTALEATCWERNIFELLPAILDTIIFCNQAFNELAKNKDAYKRMEKAIALQYDVYRVNMLSRQIYDVFYTQGLKYAKPQYTALKELAEKNKEYPRFLMCYHYMSLYYKASAPEYIDNMQVVSRHLTELKRLYAVYPHMPMMNYRANYSKHFHFHFNQIAAFFHNNRCEFEDAYQAVKKMWDMTQSSDTTYKQYKTEAIYFNYISMQCITGRYKDALDTCTKYVDFIKGNNHLDRLPFINMLKLVTYLNAFPQTFKLDAAYLHEQADEYIKYVKKQENIEIPLSHAMFYKAMLYLTEGKVEKAKTILLKQDIRAALKELAVSDIVDDMVKTASTGANSTRLMELAKKIQLAKAKTSKSEAYQLLQIMGNYAAYCIKKQ